jgi:hypothetical protein
MERRHHARAENWGNHETVPDPSDGLVHPPGLRKDEGDVLAIGRHLVVDKEDPVAWSCLTSELAVLHFLRAFGQLRQ